MLMSTNHIQAYEIYKFIDCFPEKAQRCPLTKQYFYILNSLKYKHSLNTIQIIICSVEVILNTKEECGVILNQVLLMWHACMYVHLSACVATSGCSACRLKSIVFSYTYVLELYAMQ